jgi:hypothetical protein
MINWRTLSLPDSFCLDVTCKGIGSEKLDRAFYEAIGPRLHAIRLRLDICENKHRDTRWTDINGYKTDYQKLWVTAKRVRVDLNAFLVIGTSLTHTVLPATVRCIEYLGIIALDGDYVSYFLWLMIAATEIGYLEQRESH